MLWKNSSVIKNLSQNVSLLYFLFLYKLISSDCLLQCRRSESASVAYLGHHYLSILYRKPLSPSGLFVSDERSPNSGIQLSLASILAAPLLLPKILPLKSKCIFYLLEVNYALSLHLSTFSARSVFSQEPELCL